MPAQESLPPRPLPALPQLRRDVAIIARPQQPLLLAGSARHVVTVHSPPADLPSWLSGLDGTVGLAAAVRAAPMPSAAARYLLAELDRAGLLDDGNTGRAFADPANRQRDALRQAERGRDGALPEAHRCRPIPVALSGPAEWTHLLGAALGDCQAQISLVAPGAAGMLISVGTPSAPGAAAASMGAGVAHLLIEVSAFDVLLSPLALPGRTACPRCWSLRTDARQSDWRDWLYGGRPPAAPQLPAHHRALVTAVAVEHALAAAAVLRNAALPGLAALERRIDLRSGSVAWTPVRPHPACGCIQAAA
jgi:hypothetical protein